MVLDPRWLEPCLGHPFPDKEFYSNEQVAKTVEFSEVNFCRGFYLTKVGFTIIRRVAILMILSVDLWNKKMNEQEAQFLTAEIVNAIHCHALFKQCPVYVHPRWSLRMLTDFVTSLAPFMRSILVKDKHAFAIGQKPFPSEVSCGKAMTWGPLATLETGTLNLEKMNLDIQLYSLDNIQVLSTTRVPLQRLRRPTPVTQPAVNKVLQPYMNYEFERLEEVVRQRFKDKLDKKQAWNLVYLNPQWGNEGVAVHNDMELWVALHDMKDKGVKLFKMRVSASTALPHTSRHP